MEAMMQRRVRSVERFLHLFPPPTGNDIVIKKSADVGDTVKFIQDKVPKAAWQTEKFAAYLKGRSDNETTRKLWQWLYDHIPYKKDEEGIEQIRSPRRLVYEGSKTGVDCDCYSFTISCVLWNLNIPHKYRITKYRRLDGSVPRWQHIYIVIPKDGKLNYELSNREDYVVLDCVKNGYDKEEPFLEYKDYNATMRLDYLDGLEGEEFEVPSSMDARDMAALYEEEELGKIGQWVKKTVKKVGTVAKKGFQVVKKVAGSPIRNAFLLAMKINFLNVGKRLRYAYLTDEQARRMGLNLTELAKVRKVREKAVSIFQKAGGKKENVKLAILKGKGNKDGKVSLGGLDMLYGDLDEEEYAIISGLGELGVAPAVALAPVVTIFKALADALKSAKGLFPAGSSEAQNFQSDVEADMPTDVAPAESYSEESIISPTAPGTSPALRTKQNAAVMQSSQESSSEVPTTTDNASPPTEGFFSKAGAWVKKNPVPTVLIVAGVGTGIYLLTKKKKEGLSGFTAEQKSKQKRKKKPKPKANLFKAVKIK